jgi:hypothetical protein
MPWIQASFSAPDVSNAARQGLDPIRRHAMMGLIPKPTPSTMNTRDNTPWHVPINARLAEVVEAAAQTPAWYDAWMLLGPESSEEERLKVYQAVRDSGLLPEEAGFYLVAWQIDAMACEAAETALHDLDEQLEAIKASHGLGEDDLWPPGEGPEEYEDLRQEYQDAWNGLFAGRLAEFGEGAMAELFCADREEFDRRSEAGRQSFHGVEREESAAWLHDFVESVADCMTSDSPMGPLGYRYREEDGFWEITVYSTPVELVGGAVDGEIVVPGFSLDLEQLRTVFDEIADAGWHSLGFPSEGPHVWIEGSFQGREVFLQVLAYAPDDEEPGMKFDTQRRKR